jgi:hypothetical protein
MNLRTIAGRIGDGLIVQLRAEELQIHFTLNAPAGTTADATARCFASATCTASAKSIRIACDAIGVAAKASRYCDSSCVGICLMDCWHSE